MKRPPPLPAQQTALNRLAAERIEIDLLTRRLAGAHRRRDKLIRRAHDLALSARQIAPHAGLSDVRIHAILKRADG